MAARVARRPRSRRGAGASPGASRVAARARTREQRPAARGRSGRGVQRRRVAARDRARRRGPPAVRARARSTRPHRRDHPRRDARRHVAPAQGMPPLPLVVLRPVAEPIRDLVLDATLRQPREDALVSAPSQDVRLGTLRSRNIAHSKPSPLSCLGLTLTWKGRLVKLCALGATLLAIVCASDAQASPGLRLGIADGADAYYQQPAFYSDLGELHAQLLRVQLHWGGVLGVVRGRPENATDPNDPAYNWSDYDEIVLRAAEQNVGVVFTIFGTPSWANGHGPQTRAPTKASDLRDFAYAAAKRYSGTFQRDDGTVLPRVRYWT